MGALTSKCPLSSTKRIIWCDTEGGMRGVPLWDVTCIEETTAGMSAYRLSVVRDAPKRRRAMLRQELNHNCCNDSSRTGSTIVTQLSHEQKGGWKAMTHATVDLTINELLASYLALRKGSVLAAWNMNGHDRHVLRRAVGKTLDGMVLWDGLPWFRSVYQLPKNTMSSNKPGTPRRLFNVPVYGSAHSSMSDAVHMRDVVCRAAYCVQHERSNTTVYEEATDTELYNAACTEITKHTCATDWILIKETAWVPGFIPSSVAGT